MQQGYGTTSLLMGAKYVPGSKLYIYLIHMKFGR
jgi:hypothetical protein